MEDNNQKILVNKNSVKFNIGSSKNIKKYSRDVPLWLITFTDLMALMLTFFVLLFSMSTPDEEEWAEVSAVLNQELGSFVGYKFDQGSVDDININRILLNDGLDLDYLQSVLGRSLADNEFLEKVSIIPQYDSLIISLPEDLLFKNGGVDLSKKGANAIFALAELLNKIDNRIEIMGQADPRPILGSGEYDNNWDLSLQRAAMVGVSLKKNGYDKNIRLLGLSSGRYLDLPSRWSEEDKLNLSRRVDIAVMRDDGYIIKYYNDNLSNGSDVSK